MTTTKENYKCFQWKDAGTVQAKLSWDIENIDLCRQFVNYPFVVFGNSSVEKLNTEIKSRLLRLQDSGMYIPSSTCMSALLRATCTGVYLRCTDTAVAKLGVFDNEGHNGTLGTLSTMVYANVFLNHSDHYQEKNWGSHDLLPFLRPCIATCQHVEEHCGRSIVSMISRSVATNSVATGISWWSSCSTARADYSMFPPVWYDSDSTSLLKSRRYPHAYDLSNNGSECYNMSSWVWDWSNTSAWSISSSDHSTLQSMPPSRDAETYIYDNDDENGICSGIISELYVPYQSRVNGSVILPQALPAYMYQIILEREMRSLLSLVPGWVSEECYGSLRKLLCASRLLRPERQVVSEVLAANGYDVGSIASVWQSRLNVTAAEAQSLLNASFYAPSYPHRSLCTDYVDVCGSFAARLERTKGISVFVANCTALVSPSAQSVTNNNYSQPVLLEKYPDSRQTVLRLRFPNVSSFSGTDITSEDGHHQQHIWFDVATNPNRLGNVTSVDALGSFQTQCPAYGFVVPDDKSHPRNHWIEGTGCAEACR